jgi:outer membrane protein TolC
MLQAATEAAEAHIAAAADEDERIAARKELVDRLKRIKDIVEAKFNANVEPKQSLLTVEAALLKAEAELATKSQKPVVTSAAPLKPGAQTRTKSQKDLSAARAYRDKLQELVRAREQMYKNGAAQFEDVLRARLDLDDAEMAIAATTDERQAARRQKVEHLKEIKSMAELRVTRGVSTQADVLAAEAELLRAMAELADEPLPPAKIQDGPKSQP